MSQLPHLIASVAQLLGVDPRADRRHSQRHSNAKSRYATRRTHRPPQDCKPTNAFWTRRLGMARSPQFPGLSGAMRCERTTTGPRG